MDAKQIESLEHKDLVCPDCGAVMKLRPSRYGLFYSCVRFPACRSAHGAHPDGRPLGIPANKETKKARIAAHAMFDPLWEQWEIAYAEDKPPVSDKRLQRTARFRAYAWLAHHLSVEFDACHIGMFDKLTCERVVVLCAGITSLDVRRWYKEHNPKANHP